MLILGSNLQNMEKSLYPLKFKPIYKQMIWGGEKLREEYGKVGAPEKTGESWEISGYGDDVSLVADGFLKGNSLDELIEIYMGDLVGDSVYEKFGTEFPVLLKYIHSKDYLSVQVHPADEYAAEHHGEHGKTEMWYVLDAEEGAHLISGVTKDISEDVFLEHMKKGKLSDILNSVDVKKGDVFFIPAGRIHAIGPGIVLAEIQQTSDMTYRIYDWDRTDKDGNSRELHLDHALKVMDYKKRDDIRTEYSSIANSTVNLADCPNFTTSLIEFEKPVDKDFNLIDSFVIYMCMEGDLLINYRGGKAVSLQKGESVLIPAELKEVSLLPKVKSTLLEVYIKG